MKKTIVMASLALLSVTALSADDTESLYINTGLNAIGGIQTRDYALSLTKYPSANVDNQQRLRLGLGYAVSVGYLMGPDDYQYGAEVGYQAYSKNRYQIKNYQASGSIFNNDGVYTYTGYNVNVLGVLNYNMTENLYLITKAGVVFNNQLLNISGVHHDLSEKVRQFQPDAAIGLGWKMGKAFSADMTFNRVFGQMPSGLTDGAKLEQDGLNRPASVNTLLFGFQYNFVFDDNNYDQ